MNSMISLRTPVWVIGAVAAFVFSLSACGDDSGNSSYNANDFSLQVESMDELPNCSKNRSGDIAEVLGEKKAYVCDNGRWEFDHDILDSVETEDDLPVCLDKNEGDSVWVVEESAVFACIDRKWEKHEKEEPESSSAIKKTASSSSKMQESSSSSVKKETSSSSKPLSSSSISQKSSSSVISSSSSVSSSMSSWSGGGAIGSITDSRDGQTYMTVTIGTQTWMAQNLNYETSNSYCYNDSTKYCEKYGRLYMWGAAMDSAGTWSTNGKGCGFNKKCSPTYPVRGVCPDGWHLPTETEWNTLFSTVGGQSVAGTKLKSTSGWYSDGNGTDSFLFSALPAGCRGRGRNGIYMDEGNFAFFWRPSEYNSIEAYRMILFYRNDYATLDYNYEDYAFSVRCLKDDAAEQKSSSSVIPQSSSSETRVSSSSVKSSSSIASSSSKTVVSSSSVKSSSSIASSSSETRVSSSSAKSSSSIALSSSETRVSSSSAKSSSSIALSSSVTKVSSSSVKSSSSIASSSSETRVSSSSSVKLSSSSSAKSSSSSAKSSSSSSAKSSSSVVVKGSMTDERDGQTYKTVTIGKQTWMARNLNYAYTSVPYNYKGFTSDSTSWCFDNAPANCTKYGRLYTWAAAMDSVGTWTANGKGCGSGKTCSRTYPVRGVCPEGWHLPTTAEWRNLFTAVGEQTTAGKMLKSVLGWRNGIGDRTDPYSFSALPAGYYWGYPYGYYENEGVGTYFWSSTEVDSKFAYSMDLVYNNDFAGLNSGNKLGGYSVRCVKD